MSSTKTNSELLTAIKQSNKTAREKRAKALGFESSVQLIAYLEGAILNGKGKVPFSSPWTNPNITPKPTAAERKTATKVVPPTTKPIIHVVDILDASGSMSGGKLSAALKGINVGIRELKEDKAEVKYTYTLCDFSEDIIFRHINERIDDVTTYKTETRGSTALLDAIGFSVGKVKESVKPGDRILVNIYTDGEENSSKRFNRKEIAAAIKVLSKEGWTFTFIGTDRDVKTAQSLLNFDESNTLVYDGTAQGLEKSFTANSVARANYSSKVSKGEDVSKGFYKDIN